MKIIEVDPLKRRRGLPEKDWDMHRVKILELRTEGRTLREIQTTMRTEYRFDAGEAEYKHRFKKWQTRPKKFTTKDRNFILYHVTKRVKPNQWPKFKIRSDGSVIPHARVVSVWNHRQRNFLTDILLQESSPNSPSLQIRLETPSPSPPPSHQCCSTVEDFGPAGVGGLTGFNDGSLVQQHIESQNNGMQLVRSFTERADLGVTSKPIRGQLTNSHTESELAATALARLSLSFVGKICSLLGIPLDYCYTDEEEPYIGFANQIESQSTVSQEAGGDRPASSEPIFKPSTSTLVSPQKGVSKREGSVSSELAQQVFGADEDTFVLEERMDWTDEWRDEDYVHTCLDVQWWFALPQEHLAYRVGAFFWSSTWHVLPLTRSCKLRNRGIRIFSHASPLPLPVHELPFPPIMEDLPADVVGSKEARFYFWNFFVYQTYKDFSRASPLDRQLEREQQVLKLDLEHARTMLYDHLLRLDYFVRERDQYNSILEGELRSYIRTAWVYLKECCWTSLRRAGDTSTASALPTNDITHPDQFLFRLAEVIEELRRLTASERANYFQPDWRILVYYAHRLYKGSHFKDCLQMIRRAEDIMPHNPYPVCRYYARLKLWSLFRQMDRQYPHYLDEADHITSTVRCTDHSSTEEGAGLERPVQEHAVNSYRWCSSQIIRYAGKAYARRFLADNDTSSSLVSLHNFKAALNYFEIFLTHYACNFNSTDGCNVRYSTFDVIRNVRELLVRRGLIMYAKPLSHYMLRISEASYGPQDNRTINAIMDAAEDSFKLAGVDIFPIC